MNFQSLNLLQRNSLIANLLFISSLFFPSASVSETTCAEVKIEIAKEVTLERQAFEANMKITNDFDDISLENVNITVDFFDNLGNTVTATSDPNAEGATFFIRLDRQSGIDNVVGGTIAPDTTADIHWLIIPAPGASQGSTEGKLYWVGVSASYPIMGGRYA